MELWIRSQDRERLVKINNIEIQHHYSYKDVHEKYLLPNGSFEYRNVQKKDKYIKSVIMCNDEIFLGEYKTKKRALKVLDEIENKIAQNQALIFLMQNFTDLKGNEEKIGKLFKDTIYEMPEN